MKDTSTPLKPAVDSAETVTIHYVLARHIGSAILSGELKPGERVGGENSQALKFGVSRPAYREAIRKLLAKGLLETRPKSGSHVAPRRRWNLLDPEVIAWTFSGSPDPKFVRDLLELRILIEPAAAALAAARRSDNELQAMQSAVQEMIEHGLQSPVGREADRRFHNCMLAASGNEAFMTLSGSIEAAVKWITLYKQRVVPWAGDLNDEHQAVLDAIAARDPKLASTRMRDLLETTMTRFAPEFRPIV